MNFNIALSGSIRKSPFFDKTVAAGVSAFTTYNHMYMPVSYGDYIAEYWQLINGVSMWDVAVERQVAIAGPDAKQLIHYLTPRNLENLTVGKGKYIPICDYRGAIINDPVLLQVNHDEYWLSIADRDLLLWARAIAAEKNFKVNICEPDVSPLAIQGPKAEAVVAALAGDWVKELGYFDFATFELEDIPLVIARSGWSKQGGFELYLCDGNKGGQLWELVREAGQPMGIAPGAPHNIERMESGLLSIGTDTDDMTNPYEVNLGKFVSLSREDDFIGKSALNVIKEDGIKRKFVGYLISGAPYQRGSEHRWTVLDGKGRAGFVSAAAWSPRIKSNIGVGLIHQRLAVPGSRVTIESESGVVPATISALPFDIPAP